KIPLQHVLIIQKTPTKDLKTKISTLILIKTLKNQKKQKIENKTLPPAAATSKRTEPKKSDLSVSEKRNHEQDKSDKH
ncbi:hypothetical protein, partial [Salmonella enterica]|uniref:hypothetical protein n=1 Tax=Salmonella enterica TaxID=28901 RepID=UPI0020C1F640